MRVPSRAVAYEPTAPFSAARTAFRIRAEMVRFACRLARWARQIVGRGACHHPDGAAGLLQGALSVFAAEFHLHQHDRRCSQPTSAARRLR